VTAYDGSINSSTFFGKTGKFGYDAHEKIYRTMIWRAGSMPRSVDLARADRTPEDDRHLAGLRRARFRRALRIGSRKNQIIETVAIEITAHQSTAVLIVKSALEPNRSGVRGEIDDRDSLHR
jgi:hypothetical protein